jgi:hypothetical protein
MKVGDLVKLNTQGRAYNDWTGVITETDGNARGSEVSHVRVHWIVSQNANWVEPQQLEVINESR